MLKPALTLMAGRTLGYAVSFALPVLLVRLFDLEQFGTYKQLFLLYGTAIGIFQVGMAESLLYFLPHSGERGGRYLCNAVLVLLGVGTAAAGWLIIDRERIAIWMNNDQLAPLLPFLAAFLLLMLASVPWEIVMTARHQYGLAAGWYALSDVAKACLFILPVLVIPTVTSLLVGAVIFALARAGLIVRRYRREFGSTLRPDASLLRSQSAYALPFAVYVVVHVAQDTYHQYAVSALFDAATFAVYAVGCLQVPLVDLMATSVVNVMMVSMIQELREGRNQAVIAMWKDTVRKLALVFFPLVVLLLVAARDLIVLFFTETYVASVPVFMVWSTAIAFAAVPMDGLLRVYAETRWLLFVNIVRLLLIAILISWFVTTFDLVGAVTVTILALAVGKGLGLVRMMHLWRTGVTGLLPWRPLWRIAAAAAGAAVPAGLLSYGLQAATPVRLAMIGSVYVVTYGVLVWSCGLVERDERDRLQAWVRYAGLELSGRAQVQNIH